MNKCNYIEKISAVSDKYGDKLVWNYIKKISAVSDKYGDKLVLLMDKYNKNNLRDITLEEAKEFWEMLRKEKKNDN